MNKVEQIIKEEFQRRMVEEGQTRIIKCFSELSDEEIWYKQNPNTNSIGNLVLHLCGNVRQYIISGIGKRMDERNRDEEFKIASRVDREILLERLEYTLNEAVQVIETLSFENFSEDRKVQGFNESVLSIIIHVIEHFSYHVGQITYYTKFVKDIDTGYYAGLDLNITS